MSYLVIARKYRPADFTSVVGQEHVTRTLINAIKRDKVSHAYLFCGPRGVGKTSIARIFSKALNCAKGPTSAPCLKCTNCVEIAQGISLAVREIDGASHNSVENVRELIETFKSLPAPGSRYKIYIIDEVHMLSGAAFNALLKSLEEPPPHTVFMLATTEVHKIPETVISRCQRHDLRALPQVEIENKLIEIAKTEKMQADPQALRMIARLSDGSLRDAESLLDRLHSFCDGKITALDASQILGSVEKNVLFALSQAILNHNSAEALTLAARIFSSGLDVAVMFKDFVSHWRELLISKLAQQDECRSLGLAEEDLVELKKQSGPTSTQDLQDLLQIAREGCDIGLRSAFPKTVFEALLVRMSLRRSVLEIGDLIKELSGQSTPQTQQRTAAPRPIPAAPSAATQPLPTAKAGPKLSLSWADFVREVSEGSGGKMLSEQLKRLEVKQFAPGTLHANGPDFSVKYLAEKDNLAKLTEFLKGLRNDVKWSVKLDKLEGLASHEILGNSLAYEERKELHEKREAREKNASAHPKIQSLQEVFPGSKIENIVIKE